MFHTVSVVFYCTRHPHRELLLRENTVQQRTRKKDTISLIRFCHKRTNRGKDEGTLFLPSSESILCHFNSFQNHQKKHKNTNDLFLFLGARPLFLFSFLVTNSGFFFSLFFFFSSHLTECLSNRI